MNTISSLGFSVLINQPTPIFTYAGCNTVSCSTIDHLITISCSSFIKTGILIADVSDHLPIFATMSLKNAKRTANIHINIGQILAHHISKSNDAIQLPSK